MANETFTTAREAAQDLNKKLFDSKGGKNTEKALEDAVVTIGLASIVAEANGWPKEEIDKLIERQKDEIRNVFVKEQEDR
ncbi:hypothetical protein KKC94_01550 [Patescibacteria group bacterium]|nr:hypothetical protein [Patescibacteria group bacterium]